MKVYSIISSARASNVVLIMIPMAAAVLRFTFKSTFAAGTACASWGQPTPSFEGIQTEDPQQALDANHMAECPVARKPRKASDEYGKAIRGGEQSNVERRANASHGCSSVKSRTFSIAMTGTRHYDRDFLLSPGQRSEGELMSEKQLDFLKGTWDLLEATFTTHDGSLQMPWGPSPIGMALISESGDFSAHVMRARRARFVSDHPTPAEKQQAYDDYFSYFGRILRLEDAEGTIVSRVGTSSLLRHRGPRSHRFSYPAHPCRWN
jgi:hypothetical protein